MHLFRHLLLDLLKNKMLLIYAVILCVISFSLWQFSGSYEKAVVSLQNISLLVCPLITLVFSSSYLYNSRDFMALLLTQPLRRSQVFWAFFSALALALSLVVMVGMGIPILLYGQSEAAVLLLFLSLLLQLVLVAMAAWLAFRIQDKAKGLGAVLLVWLFFTLVYDGIALFALYQFQDYPLMLPVVLLTSFNPIDLSRVSLLLHLDISALMGFTGAVYKKFFQAGWGILFSCLLMTVWAIIPMVIGRIRFRKFDF